jgi:hypothetical protein
MADQYAGKGGILETLVGRGGEKGEAGSKRNLVRREDAEGGSEGQGKSEGGATYAFCSPIRDH